MIPLRDNVKAQKLPLANYLLIAVNIAVFAHELTLGDALPAFAREFGLVPWDMTQGIQRDGFSVHRHIVPWFSAMFVHGGWLHLISNLWFLHIFGDNVEDRLGKGRFLVLYLCGGLVAGLAQVVVGPSSDVPMVGASGAISAVVGAYLLFYPRARVLTLIPIFILFYFAQIPAFVFIGIWFFIQVLYGQAALNEATGGGGVAWWAHIGGFLSGLILALVLRTGTHAPQVIEFKGGRRSPFGSGTRGKRR